MDLIS
jgi:hypothetical protein